MKQLTEKQIINGIKKELKELKNKGIEFTSVTLYEDYAGWQDWMNQFTNADDLECCSESELEKINKIQIEGFFDFLEDESKKEYKKSWEKLAGIKWWWNKNVKPEFKTTLTADTFRNECVSEFINTGTVEIRSCYSKTGNPVYWF